MADDQKLNQSSFNERLLSASLLFLALGSKKFLYDKIRGRILPKVTTSSYFQRFLNYYAPSASVRTGSLGQAHVESVFQNLASGQSMYARYWNLLPSDKIEIQSMATTMEISTLKTPERNFVHRVVKKLNPAYYETYAKDDVKIFEVFKEIVGEGLDSGRAVRSVVSEEYDLLKRDRETIVAANKRASGTGATLGDIARLKDSRFPFYNMSKQEILPSDVLDRKWKMYSESEDGIKNNRFVEKGTPIVSIDAPVKVTDEKRFRLVTGFSRPGVNYLAHRSDIDAFIQKLSMTRADNEAINFFKHLDPTLRAEIARYHVGAAIHYSIERTGPRALEGIVEISIPSMEKLKTPLKMRVPISIEGVVSSRGTDWVLHKVRDVTSVFPGARMQDLTLYDIILGNVRKSFGTIVWGDYLEGRPSSANRNLAKRIVDDSFKSVRQLATDQPAQVDVARAMVIDIGRKIEVGGFSPGLVSQWMVADRIKSMNNLKNRLSRAKHGKIIPGEYIALDFETFKSNGNPHSVTLVYIKNGEVVDMFHSDINPQSKRFGGKYTYPENDLRLSFGGASFDEIKTRLEGPTGGMNNFNDVRRSMMEFVRKHVPSGKRIPLVAYGHSMEEKIMSKYFHQLQSVLSDWYDPMDVQRALTPSVAYQSLSEQNIGIDYGYLFLDKSLNSYRPTKAFLDILRADPKLLSLIEKNGGRSEREFVRQLRTATSNEAVDALTLHMATMDVITMVQIMKHQERHIMDNAAQINEQLSKRIYTWRRGFIGITNPVLAAHRAINSAGTLYQSANVSNLLAGKIPGYDMTALLPLTTFGTDPTRPFAQRVMGGRFIEDAYPSIVTGKYLGLADKRGTLFKVITVGNVDSPLTSRGSSLIDSKIATSLGQYGYPYKVTIPRASEVTFHKSIADLLDELNTSHPEQHSEIIARRNKQIQKDLAKRSKIAGWLPSSTTIAQLGELKYRTKNKLYSEIENIVYNTEADELVFKFRVADRPGIGGQTMKLQIGTHKGVPGVVHDLGQDAVVHLESHKRGRSDVILGHIMRISESLQSFYRYKEIRHSPEFTSLVQRFINEVNDRHIGLNLHAKYGTYLQFVDTFSDKDIRYLNRDLVLSNIERFSRREWTDFVTSYSASLFRMAKKLGIEQIQTGAAMPYWTAPTIKQYLSKQWLAEGHKTPWDKLSPNQQKIFLKQMESETLDYLRSHPIGEHMNEKQRIRMSRLFPGAPSSVRKLGNSFQIMTAEYVSRPLEQHELYSKGTMVKIPYLDSLVVGEEVSRRISAVRTPAQQDWYSFYRMSYDNLAYGSIPDSKYPTFNASQIKLPDVSKNLKELSKIVQKQSTIYIPELNIYYNEMDGVPEIATTKSGELKPGLTQEKLDPGRYMHPDTLRSLYGQNPRYMEFSVGEKRSYIPIPGLSQISGIPTPKATLSTGDVYQIVQKQTQLYLNMVRAQQAYDRAIERSDEKAKEYAVARFNRSVEQYRQDLLYNKSLFMTMLNPEIPGVQGKTHSIYLPGETVVDTPKNRRHLVAGFGVQSVHFQDMTPVFFEKAIQSHMDSNGNFIGGTMKKYTSKEAFEKAVMNGDELLVMSLIRRPAESATAWLDTFVKIIKDGTGGLGLQQREQILAHFDVDGDTGALVFNTFTADQKEQGIANLHKRQRRWRQHNRELIKRVNSLEQTIRNYETIQAPKIKSELKSQITSEIEFFMDQQTKGLADVSVSGEGISIATPTDTARRFSGRTQIRKGLAYKMNHHKMNLSHFKDDIGLQIASKLSTSAEEEYSGYLSQILTKTATPFAFTPAHKARLALTSGTDPKLLDFKDMIDKFYGKVTALKKFTMKESEELVYAFMNPDSISSSKVMKKYMGSEFSEIEDFSMFSKQVRKMNLTMGPENVRHLIRGAIRGVPMTSDILRAFHEASKEKTLLTPDVLNPREPMFGKLKGIEARLGSMKSVVALSLATLLFVPERHIDNDQVYKPLTHHKVRFNNRVHVTMNSPANKGIRYSNDRGPGSEMIASHYPIATQRIENR